MFDARLRPLKDRIFDPLSRSVPAGVTPTHLTGMAFVCGLLACASAATGRIAPSVAFWLLNRALDCLDGAVARHRGRASDLGGFLDLLGDFVVYSLVPIGCAFGNGGGAAQAQWLAVALLEAAFHVNNFVLFYAAAVEEKARTRGEGERAKGLTSVSMRPAVVEGAEAGAFFTLMLLFPTYVRTLSYVMLLGVSFGTLQRVRWMASAMQRSQEAG